MSIIPHHPATAQAHPGPILTPHTTSSLQPLLFFSLQEMFLPDIFRILLPIVLRRPGILISIKQVTQHLIDHFPTFTLLLTKTAPYRRITDPSIPIQRQKVLINRGPILITPKILPLIKPA
jgi:hypothetical protein